MRDFDHEIEEKESEIVLLKIELVPIFNQFITITQEFLVEWYSKEAKKTITADPDKAVELGVEKLKEIKEDIQKLKDCVKEIVDVALNKESFWWHKKENEHSYTAYNNHKLPDFLDKEFRFMLGELGKVFLNHNFIKVSGEHSREYNSSFSRKEGRISYAYGMDIDKNVLGVFWSYAAICRKGIEIRKQIDQIIKEKQKANIGDLWDSI